MAGAEATLFVDTNVFMRVLTGDHETQSPEARRFFERAEAGDFHLVTSHLVLAEIAWLLRSSLYGLTRERIAIALTELLALRSLNVERPETLRAAIELYAASNVDFIDAYNAAEVRRRGLDRICSYDRDFDRLGPTRVEPGAL